MAAQEPWNIEGMTPKEVMEKIYATFVALELQAIEFGRQRGYKDGHKDGYEEGYKDGHKDGMTEAVTTITE